MDINDFTLDMRHMLKTLKSNCDEFLAQEKKRTLASSDRRIKEIIADANRHAAQSYFDDECLKVMRRQLKLVVNHPGAELSNNNNQGE